MLRTLLQMIVVLGYMLLIIGFAALCAAGLIWIAENWQRIKLIIKADDLHDVYAREKALTALSGLAPTPSTDLCRECNGRILPENNTGGICHDCWDEADRRFYADLDTAYLERDMLPVADEEWAALWRVIGDEALDEEDHR